MVLYRPSATSLSPASSQRLHLHRADHRTRNRLNKQKKGIKTNTMGIYYHLPIITNLPRYSGTLTTSPTAGMTGVCISLPGVGGMVSGVRRSA